MSNKEFIDSLKDLNIIPTEDQLSKLKEYCVFLLEYNKHTNLTAIKNEKEVYLKHFYDSLTIVKAINLNKVTSLLDIGTGAGFPGLVIKIFYPNIDITLLDSNNKKITFLKELCAKLNINVTLVNDRAEKYIIDKREKFDLVTTRAVAQLPVLLELAIPFLKVKGKFIALKANIDQEIINSKNILNLLNSKISQIIEFKLPFINANRTLIVIDKINETPSMYPRTYEKIIKNSLQKGK